MKNKLQYYIKRADETQGDLAKALDISESILSWKINGKSQFKQAEIQQIKKRYGMTAEEVEDCFFCE